MKSSLARDRPADRKSSLPELVVTRRRDAFIVIALPNGELIEVVVLSVEGNPVELGTDAPKQLPVVREELLELVVGATSG